MASDALFLALANAKAEPDPWARDFNSVATAGNSIAGGYMQGKKMLMDQQEARAKVLDAFGNLSDKIGYNRASTLFAPILQSHKIKPEDTAMFKTSSPTASATVTPTVSPTASPNTSPTPAVGGDASIATAVPSGAGLPASNSGPDFQSDVLNAVKNPDDYGSGQIKRLTGLTTLQQNAPVSFDQARAFFGTASRPEIAEDLISASQKQGQGYIPKDLFDKAAGLVGPRSDIAHALDRRTDLQVANAINHNVNALTSSGALGQTGKNNLRIARVSRLLQRPGQLTPGELNLVKLDMSAIAQGGVPDTGTVEDQRINSYAAEFAKVLSRFSNQPEVFNDKDFRSRTVQLGNEMIAADNAVQDKAFEMVKANFGHLTTPEHLERIHRAMLNGEQMPIVDVGGGGTPGAEIPGGGTGDPEADRAIQMILNSTEADAKKQAGIQAIRARAQQR